jgi:glycosyltransferase involved in cell wall biosynthesis
LADYEGALFVPVGDSAAISEKLSEIYTRRKSGSPLLYNPPQNTWDEIAKQYEQIIEKLRR